VIDSGLKSKDFVSFVATDNRKGGRLGGEHLAALLGNRGRVVMLRYAEGSESTIQREEGFLEALGAHRGITVASANQYGGADVEGAYKKSEALLSGFKRGDGRSRSTASSRPMSRPRWRCSAYSRTTGGPVRCASSASTPP